MIRSILVTSLLATLALAEPGINDHPYAVQSRQASEAAQAAALQAAAASSAAVAHAAAFRKVVDDETMDEERVKRHAGLARWTDPDLAKYQQYLDILRAHYGIQLPIGPSNAQVQMNTAIPQVQSFQVASMSQTTPPPQTTAYKYPPQSYQTTPTAYYPQPTAPAAPSAATYHPQTPTPVAPAYPSQYTYSKPVANQNGYGNQQPDYSSYANQAAYGAQQQVYGNQQAAPATYPQQPQQGYGSYPVQYPTQTQQPAPVPVQPIAQPEYTNAPSSYSSYAPQPAPGYGSEYGSQYGTGQQAQQGYGTPEGYPTGYSVPDRYVQPQKPKSTGYSTAPASYPSSSGQPTSPPSRPTAGPDPRVRIAYPPAMTGHRVTETERPVPVAPLSAFPPGYGQEPSRSVAPVPRPADPRPHGYPVPQPLPIEEISERRGGDDTPSPLEWWDRVSSAIAQEIAAVKSTTPKYVVPIIPASPQRVVPAPSPLPPNNIMDKNEQGSGRNGPGYAVPSRPIIPTHPVEAPKAISQQPPVIYTGGSTEPFPTPAELPTGYATPLTTPTCPPSAPSSKQTPNASVSATAPPAPAAKTPKPTTKQGKAAATSREALAEQIRSLPAVLYTKSSASKRIEKILRAKGLPLISLYIDKVEDKEGLIQKHLEHLTGSSALPYLFICGTYIGSDEHVEDYEKKGQIEQLVEYVCKSGMKEKKNKKKKPQH